MKLAWSLLALFSLSSSVAMAADGSSGCGAGWYVFKDNSLVSSLSRAYTNVTFSSTFGMTSGTSNCAKHSIVDAAKRSLHFADANYEGLMVEASQGRGEMLGAFAETFGCHWSTMTEFQDIMRTDYRNLFPEGQRSPEGLVNGIRQEMLSHPMLQASCGAAS